MRDYKAYIIERMSLVGGRRGYQAQLAHAAGCQPSFLSQVLNGPTHLTPDQASGLAAFWNLSDIEAEYFLTLVHLARCSAKAYKAFLLRKLKELEEQRNDISKKLKTPRSKSKIKLKYYSTWHYAAIHVLLSVPGYQTSDKIARHLRLPLATVDRCLTDLVQMDLIEKGNGDAWRVVSHDIHLEKDSPWTWTNHAHWRVYATQRMQEGGSGHVHYTGIYALSQATAEKLRDMTLQFIADSRKQVALSEEEALVCWQCDFFPI